MKIRTNKQIEILQTEAKNIANKLKKEVVAIVKGKGVQYIQVQAGVSYQLNFKDFDVEKLNLIAKKVDDDLEIMLEDSIIIFDNYFSVCIADLPCLVSLPFDNAKLYHIVSDIFFTLEDGTQIVYFYGKQSIAFAKSDTVNTTSYQGFYDTVISNTVNVITLLSVIIARNSDNNSDDTNSDDTNSDDTNTVITGTFSAGKYIKPMGQVH